MFLFWPVGSCEAPKDLPCLYCSGCVWSQTHTDVNDDSEQIAFFLGKIKSTETDIVQRHLQRRNYLPMFFFMNPSCCIFLSAGKIRWSKKKKVFQKSKPRLQKLIQVWINCGDHLLSLWSFCCRGQCASPGWLSSQQVIWSRKRDNASPFHPARTHLLLDYSTYNHFPYAKVTKFILKSF